MLQDAGGVAAAPAPPSPPLTPPLRPSAAAGSDGSGSLMPPAAATPRPITWRAPRQEDEGGIVEIEAPDRPPPPRPVKKKPPAWQPPSGFGGGDGHHSYNTAAEARRNSRLQQATGPPPKLSHASLLSSAAAHAALERCLLGVDGGQVAAASPGVENDGEGEGHGEGIPENGSRSSEKSGKDGKNGGRVVDYSGQCRPGHVIDLLELRRLSSRGVPDGPPDARRNSFLPTDATPDASALDDDDVPPPLHPSSGLQMDRGSEKGAGSLARPNRSYRPLVWRVLLGYLPPRTMSWNDVLERDRRLYASLVGELFSSTCPAPHDLLGEGGEDGCQRGRIWDGGDNGNEVNRGVYEGMLDHSFVIDGDDSDGDGDAVPPATPVAPPSPPATTPTVTTPGLLSARMQQEWVRGEAGGKDSIFHRKGLDDDDGGTGPRGGNGAARLSPMCAMNTPRTRIRKDAFRSKLETNDRREGEGLENGGSLEYSRSDGPASPSAPGDGGDGLSERVKESLLLPDDNDDESEAIGTIDVGEGGGNANNEGAADALPRPPSSDSASLTRSVSISHTASEEEGVELCRQSSDDAGNDGGCGGGGDDNGNHNGGNNNNDGGGGPVPSPAPPADTDEEENVVLLDEIRKDVIRTHPDLRFFLEPNEDLGQKRYAALERILFVWAKLNKGVRYVQGMNEIVGTLYFVLAHDSNEDWAKHAEADTYFLFNSLMVEMRDVFVPDLDEADTGIHGRISNMITLLSLHDPEVRCHLDGVGIDPSFYSVRWLTTLLSREFLLPDTIRLWDSMFASTHKDNFLRYVSVTMVMVIRDQLLSGDFSECLRLLQAYPPTNLDRLLESSRALWIYESQITLACHKGGISLGHALRSIPPPPAIVMAYGLEGGVAPPIREQVRQAGERGLRVARGAVVNGAMASSTVASAGRSFFGNAINFWRSGSSGDGEMKSGGWRPKTTSR